MKNVNEILAYIKLLPHSERQRLVSLLTLMYLVKKEEEEND